MPTCEDADLTIKRDHKGKMRIASRRWEEVKMLGMGEVLEIRNVEGRLHIARKPRRPDEWDPPVISYDPYGPDNGLSPADRDE